MIVLAGSAGAVPTIYRVLRSLARANGACLLLSYHRAPGAPFPWGLVLTEDRYRAHEVGDAVRLRPNTVYYARSADSMVVEGARVHAVAEAGPPRPSIDRLLESVAAAYRERVWAILLSGMGSDGVAGLRAVRAHGGRATVERPSSAAFPQLPATALAEGAAEEAMDATEIVPRVVDTMAAKAPARP